MAKQHGFIMLSRRFFESDPFWNEDREYSRAEAWIDLIQLAAWRPTKYATNGRIDALERGEFVASVRYLATRWNWSKDRVLRHLKGVEKARQIARQRIGQHGIVYLVVNYDTYQSDSRKGATEIETPSATKVRQRRDKEEESKKERITTKTSGEPPIETDVLPEKRKPWVSEAGDDWKEIRGGFPNFGKLAGAMGKAVLADGWEAVRPKWRRFLASPRAKYGAAHFVENMGDFAVPELISGADENAVLRAIGLMR